MNKIIVFLLLIVAGAALGQTTLGTWAVKVDSLELQDGTTATRTQTARIGASNVFATFYVDASSDGQVKTFTCDATGNIGAAAIDTWNFSGAATITELSAIVENGYAIVTYDDGTVGKIVTFPISTEGDITESITSYLTYRGVASSGGTMYRIPATNYYINTYALSNALMVNTFSITSGTLARVDSLKLTGYDCRYCYSYPLQIPGSDSYVLPHYGASSKGGVHSFTCTSAGDLGAAPADSIIGIASGQPYRLKAFLVNDSLNIPNRVYVGYMVMNSGGHWVVSTISMDKSNADIVTAITSLITTEAEYTDATGFAEQIGDDWWMFPTYARTFKIAKIIKADGIIPTTNAWDYTRQFSPTASSGLDIVKLSYSAADSISYFLYSLGGLDNDCWVHSMAVKGGGFIAGRPGKIQTSIIDSAQVCTNTSGAPFTYARMGESGSIWVVGYKNNSNKGTVKTYECTPTGDLGAVIDSLQFTTGGQILAALSIVYTGGEFIGIVFDDEDKVTWLGSIAVSSTTGEIGSSATVKMLAAAGGDAFSPYIYRLSSSNNYIVVHGNNNVDPALCAGWVKTYTINNSTGELGPSGFATLAATDSLKMTTGYFRAEAAIGRIGLSDYYGILSTSTALNVWKLRTIDINSTTGAIGNAWLDSLTICTKAAHEGDVGVKSAVLRMGTVNSYYLVQANHQGGAYFGTVGISEVNGVIDDALIDTWDNTVNVTCSSPVLNVGGDIYVMASKGSGNDGYIRTIEINDTTAKFEPTNTKSYRDQFEFNPVYAESYNILGKLSSVASGNNQTSYFLFESRDSNFKMWLYTESALAELDEFGWAYKVWGLNPAKIHGAAISLIKKVMSL